MSGARTPLPIRFWRLLRLFAHLLHGMATAALVLPRLTAVQREQRIQQWCGKVLALLHIRPEVRGTPPEAGTQGALFVANHVSWIDIWALKSCHPMRFVAKAEIRGWPMIGWLAEQTGTLFIERHKRQETGRMMGSVEEALRGDDCLCFFPEGTTTDGTELKPFKSSLFQAAINAGATVWPLAIHYPASSGGTNTAVAYHGDITMPQSLWEVLGQREIVVELDFAAPLAAQGAERRQLAQQARQAIACRLPLTRHTAPETAGDPQAAAR